MTPEEITDINGKKVEVGHIVRMYTELFIVVLDEGMLKGVKLSGHSRVIYLPNHNRHIEIVACTLDYTDLQLKEERERAGKDKAIGMELAVEFGYKQCEKGNNLETAMINYKNTIV